MNADESIREGDFKAALLLLEEIYVAFFHLDVLSASEVEGMAELLSKPYIRKMMRGNRYFTNRYVSAKEALASLNPQKKQRKKTDKELSQLFRENRLGELEDYLEENGHESKPPKTEVEKALKAVKEHGKEITKSKAAATRFLKRVGILDKDGNPSKRYYPERYDE
jgi:hypothetical protein